MILGGGTMATCPTVPVADSRCRRPSGLRAATRAIRRPATTGDRVRAWKTPEAPPAASATRRTGTALRKAHPPASKATNAAPPPAAAGRPSAYRDRVPRRAIGAVRPPRPSATGSVRDMKTSAEVVPPPPIGRVREVPRGATAGLPPRTCPAMKARLGTTRAPRPRANTTLHPLRAITTCLRPHGATPPLPRRDSAVGVPRGELRRADSAGGKHYLKKDPSKKLCKKYHDFSARLHSALPPCSWEVPWRGKA